MTSTSTLWGMVVCGGCSHQFLRLATVPAILQKMVQPLHTQHEHGSRPDTRLSASMLLMYT